LPWNHKVTVDASWLGCKVSLYKHSDKLKVETKLITSTPPPPPIKLDAKVDPVSTPTGSPSAAGAYRNEEEKDFQYNSGPPTPPAEAFLPKIDASTRRAPPPMPKPSGPPTPPAKATLGYSCDSSAPLTPPPMPTCGSKAGETIQGSTTRKVGQAKRFSQGLLESLRNTQQLKKTKTRRARASAGRHLTMDALIASKNRLRKIHKPEPKKAVKAKEDPLMQIPEQIRLQIQEESDCDNDDNNSLSNWSVSESIRPPFVRCDSSLETASPEVVSQLAEAEKELTEMDKKKAEEQQAASAMELRNAQRVIMNLRLTRRETGGSSSSDSENSSS